MVDEKLRKEMSDAYADGDYRKALKISRQLDKQILTNYPDKLKPRRKSRNKKNLEI